MRRLLAVLGAVAAVSFAGAAAAQGFMGSWSRGTQLPIARSEDSVAAVGNTIYVIGGYAPAGPNPGTLDSTGQVDVDQPLVQAFDLESGRWSDRAPLPRGKNHVGVAALGGKIYAFGGFVAQNRDPVADANVYDPATKRYTTAAPLPVGRDHMGLVAYGEKLYAIAGRIDDFGHNTSYVDIYDPKTNRWTEGTPMPSQRSGMAVVVYRDRILAIGGERAGGTFTNNEAYDPRTNEWTTLTALPEGRHGTGAVVIGDSLYLPAGAPVNGGSRQSDTLFIFKQS